MSHPAYLCGDRLSVSERTARWWCSQSRLLCPATRPPKKSCRIPFILFFVLELSLYFFGFIFRNELPDNVIITIQYICNTWYIASIYITLSLLVLELIRLSQRIKPWFPKWMKEHWQPKPRGIGIA